MNNLVFAIAKALGTLNQREYSTEFERLATLLAVSKIKKIETIREALVRAGQSHHASPSVQLGSLLPALNAFYEFSLVASAKKKSIDNLKALLDVFTEYDQFSVDELCEALSPTAIGEPYVDHQLVDTYLDKLEKALGDEHSFPLVYKALTADKRVAQPEAVELASRFIAPVAKSTSRPKALRRVLYRHEKLLESRAASASIAAPR